MRTILARNHGPATNLPPTVVVVHGTVSPCQYGQVLVVAKMFAATSRDASTQTVTDPGETIRCVPDNVVAYGAPPNTHKLHHELTDPQKGSPARWQDALHVAMLRRAAAQVAADCAAYKIPIRKLNYLQLRLGWKGICGHVDISNAWHQTDHVDPGPDFPWSQFLSMVKAASKSGPAPTPGDDMPTPVTESVHDVQQIPAGQFTGLVLQHIGDRPSPSIVKGAKRVDGQFQVYLNSPVTQPGGLLQAYLVDANTSALSDQAGSVDILPGQSHLTLPVTKSVPDGHLLRLRILLPEARTVTYVRSDLNSW